MHDVSRAATVPIVEKLKGLVERLSLNDPGEHILVWVYFVKSADGLSRPPLLFSVSQSLISS